MLTIITLITALTAAANQSEPIIDDIRALSALLQKHFTGTPISQADLDAAQVAVDRSNAQMNVDADAAIAKANATTPPSA